MVSNNVSFKRQCHRIGRAQERQRWRWEAEQAAEWAGYRRIPADHPLVAADVVAGQIEAEDD